MGNIRAALVIVTLSFFASIFSGDVVAQSQTKSEEYAWLESASPRTAEFAARAQAEVAAILSRSTRLPDIEKKLLKRYPADVELLGALAITESRKIVWSRKNYEDIFTDHASGQDHVIFQTSSRHPQIVTPLHLTLSPSKKYVIIQFQVNGSIDVSHYLIYDLERRRLHGEFRGLSYMLPPGWASDDVLVTMHPDSSPRLSSALYVDLQSMRSTSKLNHSIYSFNDWVAVTSPALNAGTLQNFKTGVRYDINTHITSFNDVEETDFAFFYVLHEHNDGSITRLKKENGAAPEKFITAKPNHWLSSISLISNDILLANYSYDSRVTLSLYDLADARLLSELTLPDNYELVKAGPLQPGKLALTVANFLGQEFEVTWDLANPRETDLSVLPRTFKVGELEIISRLEEFKGHDGQKLPARIVYLKSTSLTGTNPTYIETYGAFNYISFYLTPTLNTMKLDFLKRGGILVGTGVRGGAERGYQWYLDGTGIHKATPAHDLASIARGLIERGLTTGKRIVSTGVSAGGDNVALAAQLYPEYFGLVIPISGIHDHLGYLQLDRWGPQWLRDYLNPYNPAEFNLIYARSPIEVRRDSSSYPQFLIVCGESDTRVSKVHSYKLKASLDEFNQSNVYLHCVENSGHWPNESYTHGVRGVITNAAIWAWVFDYLDI